MWRIPFVAVPEKMHLAHQPRKRRGGECKGGGVLSFSACSVRLSLCDMSALSSLLALSPRQLSCVVLTFS